MCQGLRCRGIHVVGRRQKEKRANVEVGLCDRGQRCLTRLPSFDHLGGPQGLGPVRYRQTEHPGQRRPPELILVIEIGRNYRVHGWSINPVVTAHEHYRGRVWQAVYTFRQGDMRLCQSRPHDIDRTVRGVPADNWHAGSTAHRPDQPEIGCVRCGVWPVFNWYAPRQGCSARSNDPPGEVGNLPPPPATSAGMVGEGRRRHSEQVTQSSRARAEQFGGAGKIYQRIWCWPTRLAHGLRLFSIAGVRVQSTAHPSHREERRGHCEAAVTRGG